MTISGNYLIGGGYTVEAGITNKAYTISNVSIANNYIGFATYGPYYPTTDAGVSETGNTIVDFTNPAYAVQALAAYEAARLPTANVVSATSSANVVARGWAPTTIVGGAFAGAHLFAGAGETNFVAGAHQYLFGGQGANILTFLSFGDCGDSMSAFDRGRVKR